MAALRVGRVVRFVTAVVPLALALLAATAVRPAFALGPTPLAPTLYVEDSPFIRNTVVRLWITPDWTYASPAVDWRASNSPATANGRLVTGATVPGGLGDWTLAAGPDGARTIYAQTKHADGTWSPVSSTTIELDTSPISRFVVDAGPTFIYEPDTDWHVQSTTPADRIYGRGIQDAGQNRGFAVGDNAFSVDFYRATGPAVPGTYTVEQPANGSSCATVCAGVTHAFELGCRGPGTFTIVDIAYTAGGDLATLDADFRLTCLNAYVMAGSIRYGSSRDVVAIDQSVDGVPFGQVDLGSAPTTGSVTLTNSGTVADTLGTAAIAGDAAGDFGFVDDACSGMTLGVGASCTMKLDFSPSARGNRGASLTISDGTSRGSRLVGLGGSAFQPVTLDIDVPSLPEFGPAETTVVVTANGGHDLGPLLWVDGVQKTAPVITNLSNPIRTAAAYTVTLGPGDHHLEGTFYPTDFYRPASPVAMDVTVGTAASLELTTVTDDGVAVGESADLVARLTTGGPVTGTLRIRDGVGGPILASAAVSGDDPSLVQTVTRGAGTHDFAAEFLPGSPSIQAASDEYELVVVSGTRPETVMSGSALVTWYPAVSTTFSSPTAGATFECRVNFANWIACTSPWVFQTGPPGTVTLKVRAKLANGLADRSPATRPWTFDPNLTGAVSIAAGATYTKTTSVTVGVPAPAGAPAVSQVGLSNDGVAWTNRAYASSQSWTLTAGAGSRTVWTRWLDGTGHWSNAVSDAITLDSVAPTATAPKESILANATLTSGRLALRFGWSGADATSGVLRYDIDRQTDGGSWGTRASVSSASLTTSLTAGHSYRFRVRAIDKAGNTGAWAYGATFRLSSYSEASGTYSGTWSTATSTSYRGDHARWSSTAGSRVRFTFTGRAFGWLTLAGPTRGQARIYVNGVLTATIDLYSPTQRPQLIAWSKTWTTSVSRTIEIRVLGTSGRPRIDVDGFWTVR